MIVNAGHGLNYQNVQAIARIPEINELNIGMVLLREPFLWVLENAVREMKRLMMEARMINMIVRTRFSPSPTGHDSFW